MSVYSMLQQGDGQYSTFDKLAYHNALQNTKGSFSVNHLLDLGELPSENCAMFANTDPSPGLPTQTCTADSPNNHPHGQPDGHTHGLVTDMDMLGQPKMAQDSCLKEEPQESPSNDPNSGK